MHFLDTIPVIAVTDQHVETVNAKSLRRSSITKGRDYTPAVKDNHPTLHVEITLLLDEADLAKFEGMSTSRGIS